MNNEQSFSFGWYSVNNNTRKSISLGHSSKVSLVILLLIMSNFSLQLNGQVLISNTSGTPNSSAMLEITSTQRGLLPPRMTAAEIGNIVSPANGLMVYNTDDEKVYIFVSTGNAWKVLNYGTGTIPAYTPPEIGDCLADGVVFYIFQSGDAGYVDGETHGLVVSLDEDYGDWGCMGTNLTAVPDVNSSPTDPETEVGARIGDGETNTDGIVQDCLSGYAADWCRDKGSEWFLPSRGELNELYKWYATDKPGNNNLIVNCGGVGFAAVWYWSSSEIESSDAWIQDFSNGNQFFNFKFNFYNVRAVRAF